MMSLMEEFQTIAYERAVKRTRSHENYKPFEMEFYPSHPEHTIENEYWADKTHGVTKLKI